MPQGESTDELKAAPVGLANPFADIAKALATLRNPKMWLRVGMFLAGFIMVWLSVWQLTGDNKLSNTSKTVIKVAGAVATKKVT